MFINIANKSRWVSAERYVHPDPYRKTIGPLIIETQSSNNKKKQQNQGKILKLTKKSFSKPKNSLISPEAQYMFHVL